VTTACTKIGRANDEFGDNEEGAEVVGSTNWRTAYGSNLGLNQNFRKKYSSQLWRFLGRRALPLAVPRLLY